MLSYMQIMPSGLDVRITSSPACIYCRLARQQSLPLGQMVFFALRPLRVQKLHARRMQRMHFFCVQQLHVIL